MGETSRRCDQGISVPTDLTPLVARRNHKVFTLSGLMGTLFVDATSRVAAYFTSSGRYFTGIVPWLRTFSWYWPRSNLSPCLR